MSNKKNKKARKTYPMVSICTPTFNRRPFYPMLINCFKKQDYPSNKIEWIIIDDGTDKIEDLVKHLSQVKYFKYDYKMTLGKKRNLAHEKCSGDIIVYMDDDDYYPPNRISHAVETLQQNPQALCAGSSEMYIYFKHIQKMYKFGPYGANHATAATFAFRRELLRQTRYDDNASLAEEKLFLKDYTVPFVQLNPLKTILVFSHTHNSFDKKTLLDTPNSTFSESSVKVDDFVKEEDIKKFFMEDIDALLNVYDPGKIENKPDVLKQLDEITKKREEMMKAQLKLQEQYNEVLYRLNINPNAVLVPQENGQFLIDPYLKMNELVAVVNFLFGEKEELNGKINYLENKIKQLIAEKIQERKLLPNPPLQIV